MPDSVEKKSIRRSNPVKRILETLVVPVFEEALPDRVEGFEPIELVEGDGEVDLWATLVPGELVHVSARAIDGERTMLRFSLLAGYFLEDVGMQSLLVGSLLAPTHFHVQADFHLGTCGQMPVGCDLVVRRDDGPLVRQRIGELLQLGLDLEWYFPLRMPSRLRWLDLHGLEIPWDELPHGELGEFLDAALEAPAAERTPQILLRLAQGFGRWRDVLRLLREHPEDLPMERFAPHKMLANRCLGRWLPALEAAEEGGLRDGLFEGAVWLSPSYLHCMIEAGKDIEALQLLGQPSDDEPDFYDWLRGLALVKAGDEGGGTEAFARYFGRWSGDAIGIAATPALGEEE